MKGFSFSIYGAYTHTYNRTTHAELPKLKKIEVAPHAMKRNAFDLISPLEPLSFSPFLERPRHRSK